MSFLNQFVFALVVVWVIILKLQSQFIKYICRVERRERARQKTVKFKAAAAGTDDKVNIRVCLFQFGTISSSAPLLGGCTSSDLSSY